MLSFKFVVFASPAGGLRNCNTAAFASFNISAMLNVMLLHFLNTNEVGTEPKEAYYAVTDFKSNHNLSNQIIWLVSLRAMCLIN